MRAIGYTRAGPIAAEVKIALDSPPNLEASGSYVWANTFSTYLNDNGIEVLVKRVK